jgi:pimeloyl-ACP methyl ester carboxylesterase
MVDLERVLACPGLRACETEYRVRLPDGRQIACLGLGDPHGPPILYFHGFPGSRLEARVMADAASRTGVRLLAIDRPGFGESTFQPGRRIRQWSTDICAVTGALGVPRFSIVGMSAGAPYALACAVDLAARLDQVVLVSPLSPLDGGHWPRGMIRRNRTLLALAARAPALARGAAHLITAWIRLSGDRYLRFMMAGLHSPDRDLFADPGYRSIMTENMAEALRQGGRGAAWELTLIAQPWDLRLEDVRRRVRLWQGLADDILPAALAQNLARTLPACEARYLPAEGHLSLMAHHNGEVLEDLITADVH